MKRILRRVILLLPLGAVLSLAFAWALLLGASTFPDWHRATYEELVRLPRGWPRHGPDDRIITSVMPEAWRGRCTWIHANTWRATGVVALETCFDPRRAPAGPPSTYNGIDALAYHIECVAAGWPLPAVERRWCDCSLWDTGQKAAFALVVPRWRRGMRLPAWLEQYTDPTTLPTSPIWSGVVVNTVVFALLLWVPFGGIHEVRRIVRRRRGLCAECAYEVRDLAVCPECGARVREGTEPGRTQSGPEGTE